MWREWGERRAEARERGDQDALDAANATIAAHPHPHPHPHPHRS
ncbi:hypothetical protein ACFYM2_02125 [Streptomyces sp. NPDC006711]